MHSDGIAMWGAVVKIVVRGVRVPEFVSSFAALLT